MPNQADDSKDVNEFFFFMLPVAALLVHERFPFHSSSEQSE